MEGCHLPMHFIRFVDAFGGFSETTTVHVGIG